jgi:hypothetical protein
MRSIGLTKVSSMFNYSKLKYRIIFLIVSVLCITFVSLPVLSLIGNNWLVGSNWIIGSNWLTEAPPVVPTPIDPSVAAFHNFVAYLLIAIGLIIFVPIILVALFIRKGKMDSQGAGNIVLAFVILTIGILILLYLISAVGG